jgi:hypothetical protein
MWTRPPDPADDELVCPRCGSTYAPGQEYCLECGLRLDSSRGLVAALSRAWTDRFTRYPGDWIWPVVLGFVVAAIGAVVAVIVADTGKSSGSPIVATHPGRPREPVTPPVTATVALPTVPRGTPTTSVPQTRTTPPPAKKKPPPPGSLTQWPANRSGYTVVVESIPARAGRSFAFERARAASRAGLPQVGVLDSSRYSSLHPGYYVVFSGVYGSKGEADQAVRSAGGKGFASAYSRQIIR